MGCTKRDLESVVAWAIVSETQRHLHVLFSLLFESSGAHARWGVVDFRASPHVVALHSVADSNLIF